MPTKQTGVHKTAMLKGMLISKQTNNTLIDREEKFTTELLHPQPVSHTVINYSF